MDYKINLLIIFILLSFAWLFFNSELSDPEIHQHPDYHFDYCQLVETVIQTHQPVFYKVELCINSAFYVENERITSITDCKNSPINFPATALPLILTIKQLLI